MIGWSIYDHKINTKAQPHDVDVRFCKDCARFYASRASGFQEKVCKNVDFIYFFFSDRPEYPNQTKANPNQTNLNPTQSQPKANPRQTKQNPTQSNA